MARFLFLLLGFYWISNICNSQEKTTGRQDRKDARKTERGLNYRDVGKLLEAKKFILKLEQKLGSTNMQINSHYNFLRVDSADCIFQTEHKYYLLQRLVVDNPLKGKIDDWNLVRDNKHFCYHVRFKMVTWIGIFDVLIIIESDKTASGDIILKENSFPFLGRIAAN